MIEIVLLNPLGLAAAFDKQQTTDAGNRQVPESERRPPGFLPWCS
jgi:hypothetical protein